MRKLREERRTFLATQLLALLEARERADYDLGAHVDDAACEEALRVAAALVAQLRSL